MTRQEAPPSESSLPAKGSVMPRPRKCRKVCQLPENRCFGPLGAFCPAGEAVVLTVDEYETIRLIDLEGMTQEECAEKMHIARTTVQAIYTGARKKLAHLLVNGRRLVIEGGSYRLCEGDPKCGRGCRRFAAGTGPAESAIAMLRRGMMEKS